MVVRKCFVDLTKSNVLLNFIDNLKIKNNSISAMNIIQEVNDHFFYQINNNNNTKNKNKILTFIEFKNDTNIIELLQDILYSDSSSEDETYLIDTYLEQLYKRYVQMTIYNKKPRLSILSNLKILKKPENKINDNNTSAIAGPSNCKPIIHGKPSTVQTRPYTYNDSLSDSSDHNPIDSLLTSIPFKKRFNNNDKQHNESINENLKSNLQNKSPIITDSNCKEIDNSEEKTQEFFINMPPVQSPCRQEEVPLPNTHNLPIVISDIEETEIIENNKINEKQNIKSKLNKIQTNIMLKRKLNLNYNEILIPFKKSKLNTVEDCSINSSSSSSINSTKKNISLNDFKKYTNILSVIRQYCIKKLDIDIKTINIDNQLEQYYDIYVNAINNNTPLTGLLKYLKFIKKNSSSQNILKNNNNDKVNIPSSNDVTQKIVKQPEKTTNNINSEKETAPLNTNVKVLTEQEKKTIKKNIQKILTENNNTLANTQPKKPEKTTMPIYKKNINEKQTEHIEKCMRIVPNNSLKAMQSIINNNISEKNNILLKKVSKESKITAITKEKQKVNSSRAANVLPKEKIFNIIKNNNEKQNNNSKNYPNTVSIPLSIIHADKIKNPGKQIMVDIHNDKQNACNTIKKENSPLDIMVNKPVAQNNEPKPCAVNNFLVPASKITTLKHPNVNSEKRRTVKKQPNKASSNIAQKVNVQNASNKEIMPFTKENIMRIDYEFQTSKNTTIRNTQIYRNAKHKETCDKSARTNIIQTPNVKLEKQKRTPNESVFIPIPYKIFRNETNIEIKIRNKLKKIFKNVDDEPKHRIENMIYMYYQACVKNKERLPPGLYFNKTKSKTLNTKEYEDYEAKESEKKMDIPEAEIDVSTVDKTIEFVPIEEQQSMEKLIVREDEDPLSLPENENVIMSPDEKVDNKKEMFRDVVKLEPLSKSLLINSSLNDSDLIEMFDVINPIVEISDDENDTESENITKNLDCSPVEISLLSRLENNLLNKPINCSPVISSNDVVLTQSTKSTSTQHNSTSSLYREKAVGETSSETLSQAMHLSNNMSIFNATELINIETDLNRNNNKIIENIANINSEEVINLDKYLKMQEMIEKKFFANINNNNLMNISFLREFSINNVDYVNRKNNGDRSNDTKYDPMNDFFIKINYNYSDELIVNGRNIKLIFNLTNNEYDALKCLLMAIDSFHYEKKKEKCFVKKHFNNYSLEHILIYYLIKTLSPIPNFLLNVNDIHSPVVMQIEKNCLPKN